MRMGGQLRIVAGMGGGRVLGFDMNAAFVLADALGVDPVAVAEFLPEIEAVACHEMNQQSETDNG